MNYFLHKCQKNFGQGGNVNAGQGGKVKSGIDGNGGSVNAGKLKGGMVGMFRNGGRVGMFGKIGQGKRVVAAAGFTGFMGTACGLQLEKPTEEKVKLKS